MKSFKWLALLAFTLCSLQSALPACAQNAYSTDQLDQLVAPIALYPDSLLMQILMAATYPQEVVEADRWCQANPGINDQDRQNALAGVPWDPSVTSLTAFPDILNRMASQLDWTEALGEAFLGQQADLLNAVQQMRALAYQNQYLQSSADMTVVYAPGDIVLGCSGLWFLPYYDPLVVYGAAWRSRHWYWPGVMEAMPGWPAGHGIAFARGVNAGGFMFGGVTWRTHSVWVSKNYWSYHGYAGGLKVHNAYGHPTASRATWKFDTVHRQGVNFKSTALQTKYHAATTSSRSLRGYSTTTAAHTTVKRTTTAAHTTAKRTTTAAHTTAKRTTTATHTTAKRTTTAAHTTAKRTTTAVHTTAKRTTTAAHTTTTRATATATRTTAAHSTATRIPATRTTTPLRTTPRPAPVARPAPAFSTYNRGAVVQRASVRGAASTRSVGARPAPAAAPARPVYRATAPAAGKRR